MSPIDVLRHPLGLMRRQTRRTARFLSRKVKLEINGRSGPLPTPRNWVFLVGCFNSGTTLLHDLLAEHPQIDTMPEEGQFLTDQLTVPREVGLRRLWALDPEKFWLDESGGRDINVKRLKRHWGSHFNDPSRLVLLEKTPANAARTRWLQAHFEGAVFIGIIRDGRAVAEGIRRKTGHALDLAARQWARSNEIMLRDFEHLQRKRLIRYEDLTARPEAILDELVAFLELEPVSIALNRPWKIHEQTASIRNMNPRSMEALTAEELLVIEREAGDMLRTAGYEPGTA